MMTVLQRRRWELFGVLAGLVAVFLFVAFRPMSPLTSMYFALAAVTCAGCWDQSDLPQRNLTWAAFFLAVPVVVLALAGSVFGEFPIAAAVIALFGLGALNLVFVGKWRTRHGAARSRDETSS